MSVCHMLIELAQVTVSTVWSGVAIIFSVTSNKSLSGQSKTLIRLRVRAYAHLRSPPMRKDPFSHVAILL